MFEYWPIPVEVCAQRPAVVLSRLHPNSKALVWGHLKTDHAPTAELIKDFLGSIEELEKKALHNNQDAAYFAEIRQLRELMQFTNAALAVDLELFPKEIQEILTSSPPASSP